jgi:succinate dehydrogenase / fumarate reductase flavoprotein subunit
MQGLADGYFVLPATIGHYLAGLMSGGATRLDPESAAFGDVERGVRERVERLLSIRGKRTVDTFHRELGRLLWEKCGMRRTAAGLGEALDEIPRLRERFWSDVNVLGGGDGLNQSLEKAGRVADFLELGDLLCRDALHREESCGGHFREEHRTAEGEALRDDEGFRYVAAWEWAGDGEEPRLHKEALEFESVHLAQRSYK